MHMAYSPGSKLMLWMAASLLAVLTQIQVTADHASRKREHADTGTLYFTELFNIKKMHYTYKYKQHVLT